MKDEFSVFRCQFAVTSFESHIFPQITGLNSAAAWNRHSIKRGTIALGIPIQIPLRLSSTQSRLKNSNWFKFLLNGTWKKRSYTSKSPITCQTTRKHNMSMVHTVATSTSSAVIVHTEWSYYLLDASSQRHTASFVAEKVDFNYLQFFSPASAQRQTLRSSKTSALMLSLMGTTWMVGQQQKKNVPTQGWIRQNGKAVNVYLLHKHMHRARTHTKAISTHGIRYRTHRISVSDNNWFCSCHAMMILMMRLLIQLYRSHLIKKLPNEKSISHIYRISLRSNSFGAAL